MAMIIETIDTPQGKIIVAEEYPSVPWRHDDYRAYYKDSDEHGPFGWGATKEDAVKDLNEKVEN